MPNTCFDRLPPITQRAGHSADSLSPDSDPLGLMHLGAAPRCNYLIIRGFVWWVTGSTGEPSELVWTPSMRGKSETRCLRQLFYSPVGVILTTNFGAGPNLFC